ncbi:MAG TPA: MOSC N-terminal beta barrel domain-containing protein [Jatrophihabitans sp.]|uniref:MOSC domain-containing protein n=1 Tax=Jatrophihabitans sp. TaxID=1932789 RepID=UPI002F144A7E
MRPTTGQVGAVSLLARYPVKSMRGERLTTAEIDGRGIVGDRQWAVYTPDGGLGSGKTSRRFRRVDGLLGYQATLDGPVPLIESPTGQRFSADDPQAAELLSDALRRPLRLGRETDVPHFDDSGLHLITTAALRALSQLLGEPVDVDRFRPNVVLDVPGAGFVEDDWDGRELRLGEDVVLRLDAGMVRCVMVDMAQGALGPDGRILKLLGDQHQLMLGMTVDVLRGGTVRAGDPAVLV